MKTIYHLLLFLCLMAGGILEANAQKNFIESDSSWVYSNVLQTGWEQVNFDDANWTPLIIPGDAKFGGDLTTKSIWGDHATSDVYMRKTFVLGDSIPRLVIDHGEDDDADVFVNGTLVSSDQNTVGGPGIWDGSITAYLIANATNVIAVKANRHLLLWLYIRP